MGLFSKLKDNNVDHNEVPQQSPKEYGVLILDGVSFLLNRNTRQSVFYVDESDDHEGTLDIAFDAQFQKNSFEDESVEPHLCVNYFGTGKKMLPELKGTTYMVKTLKKADEREDTLYIFEHEPLIHYRLKILDITADEAHIQCAGKAITDGYTVPYKRAAFTLDCRLPVIMDADDWKKYGL